MPAKTPEESSVLFTEAINQGDLEALIELYEPNAISLPPTGDPAVNNEAGRRELFAGMLALKPTVDLKVIRSLESGGIAQVTGSWTLSATAPDGAAIEMAGYYADVLRRQADGAWLFVLDNPLSTS